MNIKKAIFTAILSTFVFFLLPSYSFAKFECKVQSIKGNQLILKNCETKGLSKLSTGDTVSITKKRKNKGSKKKKSKKKSKK